MSDGLQVQDLHAQRANWALGPISFSLAACGWCCVVGANGSGKSTLLQALAGLIPSSGTVTFRGESLQRLSARERARKVAWLGQEEPGLDDLSVLETVLLGYIAQQGWLASPTPRDRDLARHWLGRLDLLALAERRLSGLSGGERQRTLIARVFATQAPLLLLDEPMNHLDPVHQQQIWQIIKDHVRQGGTVVSVVHDLNLALQADAVLVLHQGELLQVGPPAAALLTLEHLFGGAVTVATADGQPFARLRQPSA
jgi:iron complex transport system ATP-binding protein